MECNISALCPEMKCQILEYLDIDNLLTFSLVSKEWYHFISSDSVWHERFSRLEKTDEEPELVGYTTDLPPLNLYTINRSLTAEQLQEVEGCQFLSINNVKLAFFFNKSSLICNRLLASRGASRFNYKRVEYYVSSDDGIVWHNYDDSSAKHTQFQHCSLLRSRTIPIKNDCFNYRHFDTRARFLKLKAYPTERQQYSGFFTSEQFLLGVCEHNMIHVYRYSAEIDEFNKTHELNMAPDVLASNLIGIIHWGNRTSTVILVGESCIWKWDLINGEKMAQVNISNLMSPGEDLFQTILAKDSQLVITKGNSNVLLLDLSQVAVAWEVKMDIFHIKVSNEYIVTGEYNDSEQICAYDVDTGSKLYEVPIPEDIVSMEDLFLSRRGDILIVIPCNDSRGDVFYFDLKNREQLKVTAQGEHSEVDNDDQDGDNDEYESDGSSVDSFDYDRASRPAVKFVDGPGETVIEIKAHVYIGGRYCNISVRLIDYRNNRSIRIGRRNRLLELDIDQYKVGWDKDFRMWTLRGFRDYGKCCNYYTMTTWLSTYLFEILIEKEHDAILSLIGRHNPTLPTKDITVLTSNSDTSGTTLVLCVGELYLRELRKMRFKVHFGLTQLTFKLIGKKDTPQTEGPSSQSTT